MLILNADEVRHALPMDITIEAMKKAYAALSDGRAQVPLRAHLKIPSQNATGLFMPAFVKDNSGDSLAVKIVTLFPNNPVAGLAFIHAGVLVMDASTGQILALLEGGTLTAIRTGAGAGAATDMLARNNCRVAAIFGAGVQARTQLEAICTVRDIETVWVYAPTREHIENFIVEMARKDPIPNDLRPADTPQQAVAKADIVCAATTSTTPVFEDTDLKAGVHINGVGSYTPEMVEIPPDTIARALVVADSRSAVQEEAGELIHATNHGLIDWGEILEIGEIALSQKLGRTTTEQITFFKSVGVAVQDAVAAQLALKNARKMGLGQMVEW